MFKSKKQRQYEQDLESMAPQDRVINQTLRSLLDLQAHNSRLTAMVKLMGIVFMGAVLMLTISAVLSSRAQNVSRQHIGLVALKGEIAEDSQASAKVLIGSLRNAMKNPSSDGVIVLASSPGGSPVQSGYVYDEIIKLRQDHPGKPIYFVVGETCASGCYYMAAAADGIYADKASIVGSIGVRMGGFGFTGAMEKLGVERRLMTAGDNKAMLDPFSPVNPEHEAHSRELLRVIHKQFVDAVKAGRGQRLAQDPDLFSGKFWVGEQALALGLIDGLSRPSLLAMEKFGHAEFVDYTIKPNKLDSLIKKFGASAMARALVTELDQGAGIDLK